jgi:hypothetical protein
VVVAAGGGTAAVVVAAGGGMTTVVLPVTTEACVLEGAAADCANSPPGLPGLEVTVPVRATTASELQELGPEDQPVSLFAISEA